MIRFDAVLFDAGGVLVLPDPTVLGPVVRELMNDAQPNCDMSGEFHTGPGYPTPY